MYIRPETDFPDRFLGLTELYLLARGEWERFQVESLRMVGDQPVVKFAGVTSREEATRLTNRLIGVPRDQVVELPEDTYYIFDLVGCQVYRDGSEELVGEVMRVERYPANDVYVVRTAENKTVLIPAVAAHIKKVDVTARRIIVYDISGLDW